MVRKLRNGFLKLKKIPKLSKKHQNQPKPKAQTKSGPTIYDPACFYAHDEFEFGMTSLYGKLGSKFERGYYELIKPEPGRVKRIALYRLFHALNHWYHFGGEYKSLSLCLLGSLLDE